nr:DUF4442 domain-containing protein [uncultured Spirosoma sp.]
MYFGTGGKILFWSSDWREVHVRLRRNIWTYNYVGTIFGGSMFSATDPFYMVMLLRILAINTSFGINRLVSDFESPVVRPSTPALKSPMISLRLFGRR